MKLKLLIFTLFICTLSFSQTKGTITGVLTDKELNNETLPFANVILKGTKANTTTDIEGKYTLSVLPGNYVIQFSFVGYEPIEVPVTVVSGKTVTINKALAPGGYKLDDVVIKAAPVNREKETALLLDQKKAVEIKQSIGAQEMSRKGVSNVEQGLTKITGVTKVGSRGIFVRGLEDRYNNLLVNNLNVPSNNPYRKILPLDIFSTDIVGVIDVFKTFNTNISGDFAGATFNIATTTSNKSETKINIGIGYTTNNNLSPFLLASDIKNTKGFLGLSGEDRAIPSSLGKIPSNHTLTVNEAMNDLKSGWNVSESRSPLNSSIGFLHSQKFNLNDGKSFAYLLSINADNSYSLAKGLSNTFDVNGTYNNNTYKSEYHYKTALATLLNLNYKTERLNLTSNTFYLRSTDNLIQDQRGAFSGLLENKNVLVRTNQLDQSDYINSQVLADYKIGQDKNQAIKAGISFATTSYEQPDRKFYKANIDNNDNITVSYGANNFIRQYLSIDGNAYLSGLLEYDLKFGKDDNNSLSFGYNGNISETGTSYRFIKTNLLSNATVNGYVNSDIDQIINADLLAGNFNYQENSNASYKTTLNENTNAAFTNVLFKLNEKWEVSGGIRVEKFTRDIKYRFNGSFSDPFDKKTFDKNYILPAINLKYALVERANLRFAASKNYTKPVTMEVIPISYINGDGTSVQGNPFLVNSDNLNFDLKYEFFPTSKELFVISAFAKHLDNPIERTFRGEAGGNITTFLNSKTADLYGVEIEGILNLGRINEHLDQFSIGANATLMETKVVVKPFTIDPSTGNQIASAESHQNRDLQGASKWLANADLKYEFNLSEKWSNTANLVYSVFGKRIYSVGSLGLDHIYELPVQQLDFVWTSKIGDNYSLKFGVNNILNPYRKQELGNNHNSNINFIADSSIIQEYKKGVGFSLSIGYTF
ncbi:TonB-dependent receptor [Flavobacterium sp. UMI-01]|uniref:TonB-dependent receptor n=1 Tax=Flavobacterium sp. UMI-01 TaxID=1441053 RepID=UPI001C7D86C4|nr:TonB-dependent receptor [Flavobacterium sp. UMI-01]GIZ09946.1 TonB-dependent receptor [Flavobacterium sp. UMI-01]